MIKPVLLSLNRYKIYVITMNRTKHYIVPLTSYALINSLHAPRLYIKPFISSILSLPLRCPNANFYTIHYASVFHAIYSITRQFTLLKFLCYSCLIHCYNISINNITQTHFLLFSHSVYFPHHKNFLTLYPLPDQSSVSYYPKIRLALTFYHAIPSQHL